MVYHSAAPYNTMKYSPITSNVVVPTEVGDPEISKEELNVLIEAAIEGGVDLSAYATKTDLNQYYNKAEVDAAIADVDIDVDLDDYAKTADVNDALALKANTADLATLATKTELSAKADVSDLVGLATKTEVALKANVSDIPDITGLATKAELDGYVSDDEAADLISAKLEREIVDELPTQNIATNKIYMKARA